MDQILDHRHVVDDKTVVVLRPVHELRHHEPLRHAELNDEVAQAGEHSFRGEPRGELAAALLDLFYVRLAVLRLAGLKAIKKHDIRPLVLMQATADALARGMSHEHDAVARAEFSDALKRELVLVFGAGEALAEIAGQLRGGH